MIDDTDRQILTILQGNARISNAEIARYNLLSRDKLMDGARIAHETGRPLSMALLARLLRPSSGSAAAAAASGILSRALDQLFGRGSTHLLECSASMAHRRPHAEPLGPGDIVATNAPLPG